MIPKSTFAKMKHAYAVVFLLMLLASCGKQHQAESLVKDFMKENMSQPDLMRGANFRKLDSTYVITDSLIQVFHATANQSGRYKANISYAAGEATKPLMITRVSYKWNDAEVSDTYYLDAALTRVVAVKCN